MKTLTEKFQTPGQSKIYFSSTKIDHLLPQVNTTRKKADLD